MEVNCQKGQLLLMGAPSCKNHPHKFLASRTQYLDHKTAINFSILESFAILIALFCSFHSWVTCSVKTHRAMTCGPLNATTIFLVAPSRSHVIDQVTQTVPKKRSKSGLYSVQGKIGIFWCRKNRKNRGKIVAA